MHVSKIFLATSQKHYVISQKFVVYFTVETHFKLLILALQGLKLQSFIVRLFMNLDCYSVQVNILVNLIGIFFYKIQKSELMFTQKLHGDDNVHTTA